MNNKKLKFIWMVCFVMLAIGCNEQTEEAVTFGNEDLNSYVSHFEALFGVEAHVEIKFRELSNGSSGRCIRAANRKVIEINPNTWAQYSEEARQALVIHELGHCVLGLRHTDDPNEPHIMNSFIGLNVKAFTENLEEEISYMLGPDHPRLSSCGGNPFCTCGSYTNLANN